jgi:HAMP domain-containing protein
MLIVLVISMLLIQNSFQAGFLNYLNNLENKRINVLERQLIEDYQKNGNWSFLPRRRGWGKYVKDATRPPNNQGQAERGRGRERRGDGGRRGEGRRGQRDDGFRGRPPPPPDHNYNPDDEHDHDFQAPEDSFEPPPEERRRPHPRRPPPQHPLHDLASKDTVEFTGKRNGEERHISLYSTEHKIISGMEKNDPDMIKRPVYLEKYLIAYLYIIPFKKLTTQLDQDFVNQQSRAFIEISLIAFVIVLIVSWLLAFYFRRRLAPLTYMAEQLTSGNYKYRSPIKQNDELGQLARDLNDLGKTLAQNQTSRQQWIADISHELRTPLSILRGELEALEDGIRPLNKKSVQSLVAEVKRLGKLVEDLYQLSLSDLGALLYVKEGI